jgi:acyl-CoA reductase-like NAD-dependent aldehyde dehydrogenase
MYSDVSLFIDGSWAKAAAGRTIPVVNPATGEDIGTVAHADKSDLDRALKRPTRVFARGARYRLSTARRSCAKPPICCVIGLMRSHRC